VSGSRIPEQPPPSLLNALAAALRPFYPEVDGKGLHEALTNLRTRPHENVHHKPVAALTVAQAAERLNCSKRQTWRLIESGQLRTVKFGPRTTRVPESEVERVMREGCE
jgi:excisionase family DNA binding protein